MSEEIGKVCPLMVQPFAYGFGNNAYCIGKKCAWYCKFAKQCSAPLLAEMFADSTVCQNVFEAEKVVE